jgi:hypothetical protein
MGQGAFPHRVGNMRRDLLDRLRVDQGPDHRARLEAVRDLYHPGGFRKALQEGVLDAVRTRMRLAQTQVWPTLRYFDAIAPLAAISTSALSRTVNGALRLAREHGYRHADAHEHHLIRETSTRSSRGGVQLI